MYTGTLVRVVNTPYFNKCSITGVIFVQGAVQCCLVLVEDLQPLQLKLATDNFGNTTGLKDVAVKKGFISLG